MKKAAYNMLKLALKLSYFALIVTHYRTQIK